MDTVKEGETAEAGRDPELWNLKTVIARTGLSRSTLYVYIERGLFPRQRVLGPRRVGWLAAEVCHWIVTRPSQTLQTDFESVSPNTDGSK